MRDAEQRAAADALLPGVQVVQGSRPAQHHAGWCAVLSLILSTSQLCDLRPGPGRSALTWQTRCCLQQPVYVDRISTWIRVVLQAACWLLKAYIVVHDGDATQHPDACIESTHIARAIDASTSSEHIALFVWALNFWLWYCVPPTRKQQPAVQKAVLECSACPPAVVNHRDHTSFVPCQQHCCSR